MELVLAMDLRSNMVMHGKHGLRATYKPLDGEIRQQQNRYVL